MFDNKEKKEEEEKDNNLINNESYLIKWELWNDSLIDKTLLNNCIYIRKLYETVLKYQGKTEERRCYIFLSVMKISQLAFSSNKITDLLGQV